jgi:alkanesulfonate monooxygenase SsuD/methylene tetrahydromethanopterin reductase-like flavin-dependent oxidoreductase (luciferase family)
MWMACTQPESFKIAGERGLGALSFGFIAPGVMEANLGVYKEAVKNAEPVGAFVNNQFAATSFACVAPTDEEAIEFGRPAAEFFQQSIGILFVPWKDKKDAPATYQYYVTMAQMYEEMEKSGVARRDFDEAFETGVFCIGTPGRVKKTVQAYADAGVDQLILLIQAGRIPHEKAMQTIRLFGEQIIPAFQAKEAAPTR